MLSILPICCLVGVAIASPYSPLITSPTAGADQKVPQQVASGGDGLVCSAEGYFTHPEDGNRFYRCVDHLKTGQVFSKYHFTCPTKQIFVKDNKGEGLCVPTDTVVAGQGNGSGSGTDDGSWKPEKPQTGGYNPVMPVVPPSTPAPTPRPTPAPVTQAEPKPVVPVTIDIVQGGGAYPQPGQQPPTPRPTTAAPVATGYPAPGGCPARYVQDPAYCNVYQACPADGKKYRCNTGSVFDQASQKCVFSSYRDGDVCNGKPMMSEALFRSFPGSLGALFFPQQTPGEVEGSTLIQVPELTPAAVPHFYVGTGNQAPVLYNFPDEKTSPIVVENIVARNSNAGQSSQQLPTFFPSASNPMIFYY